jgi:carbonic anhydrase
MRRRAPTTTTRIHGEGKGIEIMCDNCGFPALMHGKRIPRREMLSLGAGLGAMLAVPSHALAKGKYKAPPKPQNVLTPEQALERLQEGNKRYVEGVTKRHDFITERAALVDGQNPYAGILSCADSRIGPEFTFDSSRGDLFVVRVAGNFLNADNLASFEYAVEVLKTPLLMVLGHDACGAVSSTISSIKNKTNLPGHLPSLVANLTPAVNAASSLPGDLLENATKENVRRNVEALKNATPLLSAAFNEKRLKVVGAIYRLKNGEVQLIA